MKRIIFVTMFFLIYTSFFSLHAQWAITYGGSGYDRVYSFQKTSDGGYIVAGLTGSFGAGEDDIWLLKLSSGGNIEWQKTYGSDYSKDWAYSVQQTGDGGYIIASYTESFGAGHEDIWILKLSSNGDIEWQKTYGGSGGEKVHSVQKTDDGGYIVAGSTGRVGGNDIWLLKLSTAGEIEWQKTYGGSSSDNPNSIQQTSDDGYIVAGRSNSFSGDLYISDIWILKLSSEGHIEWQKTYGVSDDWKEVHSIQQTSDGGYIVAGEIRSVGVGLDDIWLLKLSPAGDIEWQKTYGVSDFDEVYSFQPTSDGGYIVVGETGYGDYYIWVLKLSPAGDIEWQKTYGGSDREEVHSIQQTSDGGYIAAGSTSSFGAGRDDIWVLKLSPAGEIEWQKTYGSNYSPDEAHSIQQTIDGGYIVAGETRSWGAGESDIWVLKLSPNGDINPLCAFINTSDAEVSDTNIMPEDTDIIPEDTDIIPEDTDIIPEDTDIIPEDTDISPQDSDANVYKLCVSDICTLTLSTSSGGTTDPEQGTYTYDTGTEVTIEAIPSGGYGFLEFRGNVQTAVRQITITMDGDKTIHATFYKLELPYYRGKYDDDTEWGGGGYDPGCFIATAAYGSLLHSYVRILRDFRDRYLMPSKLGSKLVKLYYKYSPFVADLISKHKALKVVVRINLLPFVVFSYSMLHLGPVITAVMLVFIFVIPIFLISFLQRKLRRAEAKNPKALASLGWKNSLPFLLIISYILICQYGRI